MMISGELRGDGIATFYFGKPLFVPRKKARDYTITAWRTLKKSFPLQLIDTSTFACDLTLGFYVGPS